MCTLCPNAYSAGTGNTTLIEHLWAAHERDAMRLGVPESWSRRNKRKLAAAAAAKRSRVPSFSFSRSSCLSPMEIDDDDDPLFPNVCLRATTSSSGSGSSSSSSSSSSSTSSANLARIRERNKKQQPMTKYRTAGTAEATHAAMDAQAEFFMYEGIPFRIADSPKLLRWVELLRKGDGTIATRRQMVGRAFERADVVRAQVAERLQASEGVTVGVDGWTNINGHKVLNLVPVAGGVAYYWDSVVLKHHSAAVDQQEPVTAALHALIKRSVRVTAIVTDNEQVNTTLYERLLPTFPFLLHIPCAAHTIQLCVKWTMKLKGVWEIQDALIGLLAAYKASKQLRVSLEKQQQLLRPGHPTLKIVKANDTRWNSLLMAAQRIVLLSSSIIPYIADIKKQLGKTKSLVKRTRWAQYSYDDTTFWRPLQALIDFLIPYKVATDVVQSDASTPADIHHQFSILMKQADRLSSPHLLFPLKHQLLRCIRTQWDTHVNVNTIITTAHLSFDASYDAFTDEQQQEASDWFIEWGAKYLHYYNLAAADAEGIEAISVLIMKQYGEFRRKTGSFARMATTHCRLYKDHQDQQEKKPAKERRRFNPRETWALCTANELATLALALLSVTASEAAVERSFSRQGIVHSKLRNRLSDDSVQMQMFFSFNTRALEQPNRHHSASIAELEEEEEDTTRAGALLCGSSYYADDEIVAAASEEEGEERVPEERAENQHGVVQAVEELELDDGEEEEEVEDEKEEKEEKKGQV